MKNKKAFTLVELIVTITILAILWTIGFLSFQSYTVYSRDVVRLSHISNMKSVLEYNYTETWRYPKPDWENNITYSWAIAWIQWDFWKDTKRKTKKLDSIPLDPLTQNTYSYSVTKNQSEFELGSIFEWDEISKNNNILNNSYADNSDFKAYISWNYNWQILKVQTGWLDYILAVPSIILSDYTDLKLEEIIENSNSKFVLNWYNNIPSNYWITNSNSWELDFLKKENFVLFEWDLDTLSESWSLQEELWTKLALAYSWTTIENNSWIKEIVNAHSWNKLYLTQNIIKSTLIPKFEITAVSVTNWCASQPNYANANFVAWTPASENQVWQNSDSNEACYYVCTNNYTWSDCWVTTDWLISFYPLENNWNDYFWNNHWNVLWWVNFNWSSAEFDGSNDYINTPLLVSNNFTWSVWFKWNNLNKNSYVIWSYIYSAPHYQFYIKSSVWNLLNSWWYDGNYKGVTKLLDNNIWYNVVLTRENNLLKSYINWVYLWEPANHTINVWNNIIQIWQIWSYFFDWDIKWVRVYNRVLTDSEINWLYYEK